MAAAKAGRRIDLLLLESRNYTIATKGATDTILALFEEIARPLSWEAPTIQTGRGRRR